MRMKGAENEAAAVQYDNWLLSIGDGTNQLKDDFVALPSEKNRNYYKFIPKESGGLGFR